MKKIFGILAVAIFIISPIFAAAEFSQTSEPNYDTLIARIDQMIARLQELKARIEGLRSSSWSRQPNPPLAVTLPRAGDSVVMGTDQEIILSRAIQATPSQPSITIDLLDSAGGFFGTILCVTDLPYPTEIFVWEETNRVLNFCGTDPGVKYKDVVPGTYQISVRANLPSETTLFLGRSGLFSIVAP